MAFYVFQLRLERETKTKISIPGKGQEGDIVDTGVDKRKLITFLFFCAFQLRLERETKTKISIPGKGQEGDILVTGVDKRKLITACNRLVHKGAHEFLANFPFLRFLRGQSSRNFPRLRTVVAPQNQIWHHKFSCIL
jgi:hypothetical protein